MAPKTNKKIALDTDATQIQTMTLNPVPVTDAAVDGTKSTPPTKPTTSKTSKTSTTSTKRKRHESESLDTSSDYESDNSLGVEESDDSIIVKDEEMSSEEASVNVAALSEKEQLELAKQEAEEFVKRQDAQKAKLIQEAVQLGLKPTTTRSGRVSVPSVEKIKRDREVIEAHLQDAKEQGKEVYRNAYKLIYGVYPDGQPGSDDEYEEDEDEDETETSENVQKTTKNSKSKSNQEVAEDDEFVPSYDEYSYEEEEEDDNEDEEYENGDDGEDQE